MYSIYIYIHIKCMHVLYFPQSPTGTPGETNEPWLPFHLASTARWPCVKTDFSTTHGATQRFTSFRFPHENTQEQILMHILSIKEVGFCQHIRVLSEMASKLVSRQSLGANPHITHIPLFLAQQRANDMPLRGETILSLLRS